MEPKQTLLHIIEAGLYGYGCLVMAWVWWQNR